MNKFALVPTPIAAIVLALSGCGATDGADEDDARRRSDQVESPLGSSPSTASTTGTAGERTTASAAPEQEATNATTSGHGGVTTADVPGPSTVGGGATTTGGATTGSDGTTG